MSEESRTFRAALAYAARFGWPVFPRKPRSKEPLTPNGFKDATTDPEQIRLWWSQTPDANIGIPTGEVSGFDALDVDGEEGAETLAALVGEHGGLPDTVEQITGSGGRHILFKHRAGLRNSAKRLPGLDVRGDGGYIVVAPSIHPSGRAYCWELSSRPGEVALACWPGWLLDALQPTHGKPPSPAPAVEDAIPEGQRNATLASLAGTMRRRGMEVSEITAALLVANERRCSPPLPDAEVEGVAASVCRYEPTLDTFVGTKPQAGNDRERVIPRPKLSSATSSTLEPFPCAALATPLRRLVEEGAAAIQCPGEFIAIPLLTAVGAAAGATHVLELKAGWEERSALNAAVVADPGTAKTAAQQLAVGAVYDRQALLRQQYEHEQAAYDAELALFEQGKADHKPQRPRMKRVVVSDTTVEAVAEILHHNPRGVLLCRDELSGWAQAMDAYRSGKGSDRQFYLSVWSGAPCTVDRKKQESPILLERPFLAVTGSLQPDTIRSLLHESRADDGFIDRILFAYPDAIPPQKWTEAIVSPATQQAVADLFERLYGLPFSPDGPVRVQMTGEAKRLWIEWYEMNQQELTEGAEILRGAWAKMSSQCARLILISHLTAWAAGETPAVEVAQVQAVARGTALAEYFKSHIRKVLDVLGESEDGRTARRLMDWLKRKGNPGVRPREVAQGRIPGLQNTEDARRFLDALAEAGRGEWRTIEAGLSGQPRPDRFFLFSHSTLNTCT